MASRVLYEGWSLLSFKMEATGLLVFLVLFILGPLVMCPPADGVPGERVEPNIVCWQINTGFLRRSTFSVTSRSQNMA
jgi:hypothetical protein